ncbi:MAG: ABC transporter permease [Acidimicrobiia bacterium]|nr:ABC transporter permease [Acidimicrobiia bacterium]
MNAALTIAAKDLKERIRDRSALILGIIAPLALALIFNSILGDLDTGSFDLRYGIVNEDGGEVASQLETILGSLQADGIAEVTALSLTNAEEMVEAGDLSAVFVIPNGFSAAVAAGGAGSLRIVGNVDAPTGTAIARSIAEGFAGGIESVQLSVANTLASGGDPSSIETLAQAAATAPEPIVLGEIEAATRELDLATFFIVGMAVFFVFFTVQFGVTSLLEERNNGTLPRLLAAPINRNSILAGKAVVSVTLGLVSMAVLVVASTFIMGANWGNPLGVAILTLAVVVSAVGIMAIVAAFSKTAEQAGNLQSIIAVGLGMLGGIFFPAALGDGIINSLSYISPHRWYVTGLSDLAGGGLGDIVPAVGALLAFGLVTTAIALPRLRKTLVT